MDNEKILNIYKEIYDLPELSHEEEVDFNFFRLCKNDYNFVVLSIYNEEHELLVTRDLNKDIGWELVGGYINEEENLIDAVNRVALKEVGLTVDELQPIGIICNNFKFNNKNIAQHGIAFIALSRERVKNQPSNIKTLFTKESPKMLAYQNKEIFKVAKAALADKNFEPPFEEIDAQKKFLFFYYINKYFISLIGRIASKKIKNKILNLIQGKPDSILDVCCGDDSFVFELENKYRPAVFLANDISWKIISLLRGKNKKSDIVFTNHNVLGLHFKKKFDLVLFKNTLHHIDRGDKADLIKKLSEISKEVIIVDIDNPSKSTILSRIWHFYYVHFLGDVGGDFLTYQEFKNLIEKNVKEKDFKFGRIDTIKGRYYYSVIKDKALGEEVEIKVKLNQDKVGYIREKLHEMGAVLDGKGVERDVYFTASHRDFMQTKECLRIRERDNFMELTYKGPTTKEMKEKKQFWKSEINIPFESGKKDVENLLHFLDFKKIVDFSKSREKYSLGKKTITIDEIQGLGYFLEIEEIAQNKEDRERTLGENLDFLQKFNLSEDDIVEKPYRDLVVEVESRQRKNII